MDYKLTCPVLRFLWQECLLNKHLGPCLLKSHWGLLFKDQRLKLLVHVFFFFIPTDLSPICLARHAYLYLYLEWKFNMAVFHLNMPLDLALIKPKCLWFQLPCGRGNSLCCTLVGLALYLVNVCSLCRSYKTSRERARFSGWFWLFPFCFPGMERNNHTGREASTSTSSFPSGRPLA